MIRKTMRVGQARTSIKLEAEFWDYLQEMAAQRGLKLPALVSELAAGVADSASLASHLRTAAMRHARGRVGELDAQLERLVLAGGNGDLQSVLELCPLPCLVLSGNREIRHVNQAFAQWLNLEPAKLCGYRLDHLMVMRGAGEIWAGLAKGRLPWGRFGATYVSPGRVRTSQAVVVPVGAPGDHGGLIVMFETLAAGTGAQQAARLAPAAALHDRTRPGLGRPLLESLQ